MIKLRANLTFKVKYNLYYLHANRKQNIKISHYANQTYGIH